MKTIEAITWRQVMRLAMIALLLALAAAQPAQAKELEMEAYGYHLLDAEFEKGKAQYDLTRSGIKAKYSFIYFNYDRQDFTWDDADLAKLPFGNGRDKPWKSLQTLALGANWSGGSGEKWTYELDGAVFSAFEEDFGGYGGKIKAWAGYGLGPNLRLRFGGHGYIYEKRAVVVPVLSLDYRWDNPEGLSLNLGVPDLQVRYGFNRCVALRLMASYEQDMYRLADDSKVRKEGFLEKHGVIAGLLLDVTPVENLTISGGLLRSLGYTMTTYDKEGDHSEDYDQESAWGGMLTLTARF